MDKKLKHIQTKSTVSPAAKSAETVAFSFRYLTSDKKYNFEKLDKGKKREWCAALFDRMTVISSDSWISWKNKGKETGYETIPADRIAFAPQGRIVSPDEKVVIFRFNNSGRIIGVKESNNPVLYIIGFDIDFSAYDHGS